jgi:uridylate kinase
MPGTKKPLAYQRILLKLSGEALMGDRPYGIDQARIESLAQEIVAVHQQGLEIAVGGAHVVAVISPAAEKAVQTNLNV